MLIFLYNRDGFAWLSFRGTASRRAPRALLLAAAFLTSVAFMNYASGQDGVVFTGRWGSPKDAPIATWPGSGVMLGFERSSFVTADLTVSVSTSIAEPKLYIAVSVDGDKPRRIGIASGHHPGFVLASGLSKGRHLVTVRDDNEPFIGSLQFASPKLAPGGRWRSLSKPRPIIEVIDDSDATGLCILGPLNPPRPANLGTPAWLSESASWPRLLEGKLAAAGHPAEVVNLSISGSTAGSEAMAYELATPRAGDGKFIGYSGNRRPSLALLWGGSNDHNQGGDTAGGSPIGVANLSPFQRGVYDQILKIWARSPDAKIVLMWYVDPNVRNWEAAYVQLKGIFDQREQKRIFLLGVRDIPDAMDACDLAPRGHPDMSQQENWADQIFEWLMTKHLVHR